MSRRGGPTGGTFPDPATTAHRANYLEAHPPR